MIVTYRSERILANCLSALPAEMSVIVVDNDSPTSPELLVARRAGPTRFIEMGYNSGFGRAANRGLAATTTPYAILVNPDVEISRPILEKLVELMEENPELAILSPDFAHGREALAEIPESPVLEPQRMVIGAAMLLRRSAFVGAGFFDERIFLFGEDDDICLSARGRGLGVAMAPELKVLHPGGESTDILPEHSPEKERLKATSYAYVIKKHDPRGKRAIWRKTGLYLVHGVVDLLRLRIRSSRIWFARANGCLSYLIQGKGALWTNHLTDPRFRIFRPDR